MFSGLVEQTSAVAHIQTLLKNIQIVLKRPSSYKFLKEGESLSVDGVCLTLESFDKKNMFFTLGPETLKITKWTPQKIKKKIFNLERSLTLQSAVGGHLLTGHVDGLALVRKVEKKGKSLLVQVKIPSEFKHFFWKKAYIALNGVSLTVNSVQGACIELCLIPKSLELTNLSHIKRGDRLNFEVDYLSRAFVHSFKAFCKKTFQDSSLS